MGQKQSGIKTSSKDKLSQPFATNKKPLVSKEDNPPKYQRTLHQDFSKLATSSSTDDPPPYENKLCQDFYQLTTSSSTDDDLPPYKTKLCKLATSTDEVKKTYKSFFENNSDKKSICLSFKIDRDVYLDINGKNINFNRCYYINEMTSIDDYIYHREKLNVESSATCTEAYYNNDIIICIINTNNMSLRYSYDKRQIHTDIKYLKKFIEHDYSGLKKHVFKDPINFKIIPSAIGYGIMHKALKDIQFNLKSS